MLVVVWLRRRHVGGDGVVAVLDRGGVKAVGSGVQNVAAERTVEDAGLVVGQDIERGSVQVPVEQLVAVGEAGRHVRVERGDACPGCQPP